MAIPLRMAILFVAASMVVQANHCLSGGQCPDNHELANGLSLLQTSVQRHVFSAAASDNQHSQSSEISLRDFAVTFALYFKVNNVGAFKKLWQAEYTRFPHKEDCTNYMFSYMDDNFAHSRGAYTNSEALLRHFTDISGSATKSLDRTLVKDAQNVSLAEITRLEIHGPAAEIAKLREPLKALPALFYVAKWGQRTARHKMNEDSSCHMYPYFKLKDLEKFEQIWHDAYPRIFQRMHSEASLQYAFSSEPTEALASSLEVYGDAAGILLHLENVKAQYNAALDPHVSYLERLEVHCPASEISKLRPTLEPLGALFYTTGWGFRDSVACDNRATPDMIAEGTTCEEFNYTADGGCNTTTNATKTYWNENKFCEQTCSDIGVPYFGDECP